MVNQPLQYIQIRDDEQTRLRDEFGDKRFMHGWNAKLERFETWYRPDNSPPYMVAHGKSFTECILMVRNKAKYSKKRAVDLLREIDEHNENLIVGKEDEAMHEMRHDLKRIASGKQIFAPLTRR